MNTDAASSLGEIAKADLRVDAAGVVVDDLQCSSCLYNVRGMTLAGSCPECGRLIADSLRVDDLRTSNPKWLAWLAVGAACLVGVYLFSPLSYVLWLFLPTSAVGKISMTTGVLSTAVLPAVGCWALSIAEPGRIMPAGNRIRLALRWMAALLAVYACFWLVSWMAIDVVQLLPPPLFYLLNFGVQALVVVRLVIVELHLHRLARRGAAPRLAKHTRWIMRLLACISLVAMVNSGVLTAAISAYSRVTAGGGQLQPSTIMNLTLAMLMPLGLLSAVFNLCVAVLMIFYVRMFLRMRAIAIRQAI